MTDIIRLLPDHIANQIAAGEVIQRPGSAVKELMENAVDAGADEIRVIIQEAGKSLVQVIDNGVGMSETDARMAFERHATSKITGIEDLFRIKTMGFRGEALASIAAVAQVELKTRRGEDASGTFIEIENSKIRRQEPVAANPGTSIAMKNLFFNVPARRNFLKSNTAELKNIVDEFIRVAMAFPDVFFSLESNSQELFHLEKGTLKQRIVQLLGNHYNARLVSVQEQTDYLNIEGFVGKPETARKTRGDQYLFVNHRYVRSPYLQHAITQAFSELIPKETFPMYALFIDLNPSRLDVNVHPTKQEIKFEDEKIVYAFMNSAIRHALAQFSITPTLDFELDPGIQQSEAVRRSQSSQSEERATGTGLFRTFTQQHQAHRIERSSALPDWKDFFETGHTPSAPSSEPLRMPSPEREYPITQVLRSYLLVQRDADVLLIHQQNAHERVLYERFSRASEARPMAIQKSLFPVTLELPAADAGLLQEMIPDLALLGYQIEAFGPRTYIVQGVPADVMSGHEQQAIEQLLEQVKQFSPDLKFSRREKLLRTLSAQQAIRTGRELSVREMQQLYEEWMQCEDPSATPDGRVVVIRYAKDDWDRSFGR